MYPRGLTWPILYNILSWSFMLWPGDQVDSTPIVGGRIVEMTEISRYSYMVSLQDRKERANGAVVSFDHFCGGSLVSSVWILTAAHCVYHKNVSEIVAAIGFQHLKAPDVVRRSVSAVRLNNFNPMNLKHDIALVKLSSSITLDGRETLGLLPPRRAVADQENPCQIIGYGVKKYGGEISDELNVGEVKVISEAVCRDILGWIMAPHEGDKTICAVGDSQDSCQGDSGGPLICPIQGKYYIYGIVSHGLPCGQSGIPSIYTLTGPYRDWIDEVINERKSPFNYWSQIIHLAKIYLTKILQ